MARKTVLAPLLLALAVPSAAQPVRFQISGGRPGLAVPATNAGPGAGPASGPSALSQAPPAAPSGLPSLSPVPAGPRSVASLPVEAAARISPKSSAPRGARALRARTVEPNASPAGLQGLRAAGVARDGRGAAPAEASERLERLFDLASHRAPLAAAPSSEPLPAPESTSLSRPAARVRLAVASEPAREKAGKPPTFPQRWTFWAGRLTDAANFFFLPYSLPQILKNWDAISAGAFDQLAAIPWTGWGSGVIANMFLLGVALHLKNGPWARVQAVGFATGLGVLAQVWYAGQMPTWAFAGLTGFAALYLGAAAVDRIKGLGKPWERLMGLAGWAATALFMYAPTTFLRQLFFDPASGAGLAPLTFLLGMTGNLLMLGEALRTRNLMWFVGSAWGVFIGGVAIIAAMTAFGHFSPLVLLGVSIAVGGAAAFLLRMTWRYFGTLSPFRIFRKREASTKPPKAA